MSTASTRTEKRAPVTLKIKFKSSTLDQFVERYSVDISQGGIFIRTKSPLEVGTPLRFEFQLKDATPLITGEGTVVWTREYDPSRTGLAPGMGVRFDRLPPESQQVLSKILQQKKSRPAPSAGRAAAADAADEFTDSPTRVAPRSVIAGLADTSRETFSDDDVPADAFEEATKVGLLDELVARTAEPDEDEPILTSAPRDRAPSSQPIGVATDAEPEDDDDEPELPAPVSFREPSPSSEIDDEDPEPPEGFDDELIDLPAPAAKRDDFPDHIPTELNLAPPPPSKAPPADLAATELDVEKPSDDDVAAAREKLGAPSETLLDSVPPLPERPPASAPLAATPHLIASDERSSRHEIEPSSGGGSGLWIAMAVGIILLAGGGGAWWMMTQQDDGPTAERPPRPAPAKQVAPEPPPEQPEPAGLEATVASPVEGATATLIGGDQTGPVPMTFTGLEEGTEYKVKVSAPGFIPAEIELKGGETPEPVELEAKPRFISVTSTPEGAAVYINKRRRGKTPFEIELKGALAKVDEYNVQLRRAGYDSVEKTIAAGDSWSEEDERMVASLDLTLNRRPVRPRPTNNDTQTSDNGDTGKTDGDGAKPDGAKPDGAKPDGAGSGDPVPDWAKDKKKKPDDDAEKKPPKEPAPKPKTEPAAPAPTPTP